MKIETDNPSIRTSLIQQPVIPQRRSREIPLTAFDHSDMRKNQMLKKMKIECQNVSVAPDEDGVDQGKDNGVDTIIAYEKDFVDRIRKNVLRRLQSQRTEKANETNIHKIEVPWWQWQEDTILRFCSDIFCPSAKPTGKNTGPRIQKKMVGESLHLCYAVYERKVCEEGRKIWTMKDKNRSLPITCYLQGIHEKTINSDGALSVTQSQSVIFAELRKMAKNARDQVLKRHSTCDPTATVCDVGELVEEYAIPFFQGKIKRYNTNKCNDPDRKSSDALNFHAFNGPETFPPWISLDCSESAIAGNNDAWIQIHGIKERVVYLQLMFMKFERDVYKGDNWWFNNALRSFDRSASTAIDQISRRKQKVQDTKGNEVVYDFKDEERHPDPNRKMKMKSYAHYLPTEKWEPMTSWKFEIEAQDGSLLTSRYKISELLIASGVNNMKHFEDFKVVTPPRLLGFTRFRKYLSKPELWNIDFWKQLHPGNLAIFQAQEEISKMYCIKLSLDPERYLPPRLRIAVKDQEIYDNQNETEDEEEEGDMKDKKHAGEVNVCNVLQIHARIAALRTATDLAPNDELSEHQRIGSYYDRANRRDKMKNMPQEEEEATYEEATGSFMHPNLWILMAAFLTSF